MQQITIEKLYEYIVNPVWSKVLLLFYLTKVLYVYTVNSMEEAEAMKRKCFLWECLYFKVDH
jgi:hypothetical protein